MAIFSFFQFIFLSGLALSKSCNAVGTRGAALVPQKGKNHQEKSHRLLQTFPSARVKCNEELSVDITCQGDCDYTAPGGTCESKMFLYHGGNCRTAPSSEMTNITNPVSSCQDFDHVPASQKGTEVFVVVFDVNDPTKRSSMWTAEGEYFKTDFHDFPTGEGLSDIQNITFYANDNVSYDTMLQTMIFEAPCQVDLESLDPDQSVQLFATAVDPKLQADVDIRIKSLKENKQWQLNQVTVATSSIVQPFAVLPMDASQRTITHAQPAVFSWSVIMDETNPDHLIVLATASAVSDTGDECTIDGVFEAFAGEETP